MNKTQLAVFFLLVAIAFLVLVARRAVTEKK